RDPQRPRWAGRDRLADRVFTGALLVNHKLPIDDFEHSWETFDAVPRVDAHRSVVRDLHGYCSLDDATISVIVCHSDVGIKPKCGAARAPLLASLPQQRKIGHKWGICARISSCITTLLGGPRPCHRSKTAILALSLAAHVGPGVRRIATAWQTSHPAGT